VIIGYDDFAKVDVRVGTVLSAAPNPAARKPAYVLEIDFGGEVGRKKASAKVTELYRPEELVGRQVAAVVNFPPKQIARMVSEVLVLGFPDTAGRVVLINVDHPVPDGARMF
jgi:tRNA-binding protein